MLEVKSLSVRCGALDIVKGVSFAVNDGEWLMIAGPNGAGKSTIINAVTGGVAYTGQILLNGQDIRKKKSRITAASATRPCQNGKMARQSPGRRSSASLRNADRESLWDAAQIMFLGIIQML